MGKKHVVLITPKKLSIDSRSIRQASSLSIRGYQLDVLEGQFTDDRIEWPFKIDNLWDSISQNKLDMERGKLNEDSGQNGMNGSSSNKHKYLSKIKKTWFGQKLRTLAICIIESPFGMILDGVTCTKIAWKYCYYNIWLPRKKIPPADLYIVHSYELMPLMILLGAIRRTPVIYDAHDFYGIIHSDLRSEKLVADRWWYFIIRCVQSLAFRYASAVITVSDGLAIVYTQAFQRTPVVIRSVYDFLSEKAAKETLRSVIGVNKNAFVVIVVGDNRPGQAVEQALQALLESEPNIIVAFIGHGYKEWKARAVELGLDLRVFDLGAFSSRSMVPFIKSASASMILDFPLTLNYLNSLPNRFFHSIAAELPLLYPNLPEMAAIASAYDLGIQIDPQDPKSIANALSSLASSPELLKRYQKNASKAAKVLNWSEEEKIFMDVVDKVMAGQKVDGPMLMPQTGNKV